MGSYRIYFHGRSGSIQGRDDVDAEDDRSAVIMAELLWEACSDVCETFEVWQGIRRVDEPCTARSRPSLGARQVTARMQEALIRREEAIRDSRWAIARSQRLLERMDRLKRGSQA